MPNVGTVNIGLVANTSKWSSGFKRARKEVSGFQGFMQTASSKIGGLFAAAFTIGAAIKITKELHSVAMEIDSLATEAVKLGSTARELDALRHAANLLDTDFRQLETSAVKLKKNIYDAGEGMKEQADAFKAAGLSIQELKLLPVRDQLSATFKALRNVRNETDQTALTMKLFGKSGAALLPIIRSNSEAFGKFFDEAYSVNQELGNTANIDAYDNALKRLSYTWENFKRKVVIGASELFPNDPGEGLLGTQLKIADLQAKENRRRGIFLNEKDQAELDRLIQREKELQKELNTPIPAATQGFGNKTPLFNMWRSAVNGAKDLQITARQVFRDIGREADLFQHKVATGWQRQREALQEQSVELAMQIQELENARVEQSADILRSRGAPSAMERGSSEAFNTLVSAVADMRGESESEKLLRANNIIVKGSQDELKKLKRELEQINQRIAAISTEGLN